MTSLTNVPAAMARHWRREMRPLYSGPPVFVIINLTPSAMHLRLQGAAFTSYQLKRSAGMNSESFSGVGPPLLTDGLGLVDFTDSGPLLPRYFYRAVENP